jgi:hypothetical protein
MPYVEVFVDPCKGDCEAVHAAEEIIRDAFGLLRDGKPDEAKAILGQRIKDPETLRREKYERDLARLLAEWRAYPNPAPFLEWAHGRRKASIA